MKLSDFEITEAYNGVNARLTKLTTDLTRNWQNSKNLAKAQYPDIDTNPQTQAAVLKNWLKTRLKVGDVDLTATDPAALISQGASKYLQNQLGLSMDAGPQAQPQAQSMPQPQTQPESQTRSIIDEPQLSSDEKLSSASQSIVRAMSPPTSQSAVVLTQDPRVTINGTSSQPCDSSSSDINSGVGSGLFIHVQI